jgi:hypothetical protein
MLKLCGRKEKRCPTQVQGWAFKMKVTPPSAATLQFKGRKIIIIIIIILGSTALYGPGPPLASSFRGY